MRRSAAGLEWMLNAATFLALAVALGLVIRDRVIPAIREPRRVDPGEPIPADLRMRDLTTGDTVSLVDFAPATVVAFLPTCPACERAAPAWRSALASRPGGRLVALAAGDGANDLAWARRELPGSVAVLAPLDPSRVLSALRIRLVPTALVVGSQGTLLARAEGVIDMERARQLLALPHRASPHTRP